MPEFAVMPLSAIDYLQAGVIIGGTAHQRAYAPNCLHVVRNDIGLGVNNLLYQFAFSLKVGNQYFGGGFGV